MFYYMRKRKSKVNKQNHDKKDDEYRMNTHL